MIGYTNINEYIIYLVENQININIIEFVKEINKLKYNIDISFIDEFIDKKINLFFYLFKKLNCLIFSIELVSNDECCIHHNMLEKYSVLKLNKGTTCVKELLEQNNFIKNKDYLLSHVKE